MVPKLKGHFCQKCGHFRYRRVMRGTVAYRIWCDKGKRLFRKDIVGVGYVFIRVCGLFAELGVDTEQEMR